MTRYDFKPYDPIFPELFNEEKARLLTFLNKPYRIEHVGSTAVPNLGGKGIIDICIEAPSEDTNDVWSSLEKAGYKLRPHYTPAMHVSHVIYLSDPIDGERKYHIRIVDEDSQWLKDALSFITYLATHEEDRQRYEDIKKVAAELADQDKDRYMDIKNPVIDDIKRKAGIIV